MNRQEILKYVEKKYQKKTPPDFRVGDTLRIHVRITEGTTSRVQIFEGVVISFKGHSGSRTFSVRKLSFGVGVERTFPLVSPAIEKIQIVRSGHVRRAKLYYLRSRVGRSAKLDEKESLETSGILPNPSNSAGQKKKESPKDSAKEELAAVPVKK